MIGKSDILTGGLKSLWGLRKNAQVKQAAVGRRGEDGRPLLRSDISVSRGIVFDKAQTRDVRQAYGVTGLARMRRSERLDEMSF
jgi:hypothetical protein